MPTTPSRPRRTHTTADVVPPVPHAPGRRGIPGKTTGRYLVLLHHQALEEGSRALRSAGVRVARASEFKREAVAVGGGEAVIFEHVGVAVVDTPPEQMSRLSAASAGLDGAILAVEPERVVYAVADRGMPDPGPYGALASGVSPEFVRGVRFAVDRLGDRLRAAGAGPHGEALVAELAQTQTTWGLQATRVTSSTFTGRGIGVAVLDTGMDLNHPDFVKRAITARSFVPGQMAQDGHGHGTHCIGTACGPIHPPQLPRYGIAGEAAIFAGKVLNNQGTGVDSAIIAGINWAVQNRCAVVSMSLSAPVTAGTQPSQVFEQVARRALQQGTLLVAAAGNESRRPGVINPVGHPANCPSILAVAAVDIGMRVASFSNGGIDGNGGQIDIAGPGVDVYSSWPKPRRYATISGTSMATPHVAGIAALYAQSSPALRGTALSRVLLQRARRLPLPARDVGAGLVQAP